MNRKTREVVTISALCGVVLVVFLPLMARLLLGPQPQFDHYWHVELAHEMASSRTISTPHFLFQLLVIAVRLIVGDYARAGAIVLIGSYVALVVILYLALRPFTSRWTCALLAMALMLIAPIPLLAPVDGHFYFGYVSAGSVYHNPTILLLKPLTIALFIRSAGFYDAQIRSSFKTILQTMGLVILSAITKPSYLICLVPSLVLLACHHLLRKKPVDWRPLLVGVMMPGIFVLGLQYLYTYANGSAGIGFAPFRVASYFSGWLLPKFVLSIAFPLVVTLLFFRRAIGDIRMRLAWLGAILGILCFYTLIETAPEFTFHGNFGWSGIITLFVLFFASTVFLLQQWQTHRAESTARWRLRISTAVFCMHVASGVLWYVLTWSARQYW